MTLSSQSVRAQLPGLARAAQVADGVAPLSEQALLAAGRPAETGSTTRSGGMEQMVWHDVDGQLSVVAVPDETGASYELVVHPDHRRHGYGASVLDLIINQRNPDARFWAHGDLAAAKALATSHGLHRVREMWRMSRPVQGDPAIEKPRIPNGFAARAFLPGQDEQAWLNLNARAFAHHPEQGRMTSTDLAERMSQDWFDPQGLLLIEDVSGPDPVLVASHWTKIEVADVGNTGEDTDRGADTAGHAPTEGEVYVVAVHPDYQGQGLGRSVTALGLGYLAAAGVASIDLYVEGDNAAAIATYRGWGFQKVSADVMYGSHSRS